MEIKRLASRGLLSASYTLTCSFSGSISISLQSAQDQADALYHSDVGLRMSVFASLAFMSFGPEMGRPVGVMVIHALLTGIFAHYSTTKVSPHFLASDLAGWPRSTFDRLPTLASCVKPTAPLFRTEDYHFT
ncbi:hypothetical protein HRR83_001500 [Exophiala dermatitidis]|uniref:Uncharacterized protein n=1 Tax=Exophiala dermatitidis TaxID=5970 RepID=A0AAN6F1U8_EXODE|nr:hypothetical protein HRR74_001504 [Exophiala dermatitidis]KAJ4526748.1 hypothetical protein HRR73_001543 [Exophiala dermatitidis]KAJ4532454.1 hypothetical protein HRR76_007446 [Exophiala dermatitidis]KAJ4547039.1 hypothetical protein HRR77_004573 [Exophiala dermatitidis]KAJ4573602.1 hypothetical protein HRR79_002617 [Exophiala dermatitidis]